MSADFNLLERDTVVADRYRIESLLGEGAYAAVYLAHDEKLDLRVAIKVLDPLRSADPVGRGRFEREYQILSSLNHPQIARCYALASANGLDILVLEYVEGETLAARLERGRLDPDEVFDHGFNLASALAACHAVGVLHRDLKPDNIVLHPERGAIVLDFGVAWFSTAMNLTRTGAVVGSPQYMAPEIFSSSVSDERADIYSLGVCMFEMLCGHPPDVGANVVELARNGANRTAPRVSSVRPGVDSTLDNVIARSLEPRVEDRFATAAELLKALRTGTVSAPAALRANLGCTRCGTPCIIDLPFCPGCGDSVAWSLEPGGYAVQVMSAEDPWTLAWWLEARHPALLHRSVHAAAARLRHLPAPLAVGICERSARQLAAEAADVGASVEIVRAWSLVGAKLRASDATLFETGGALVLHFVVTIALVVAAAVVGGGWILVSASPLVAAVLGMVAAHLYIRRPLLHLGREQAVATERDARTAEIRKRLHRLERPRTRSLAAAAVARASRLMIGEGAERPDAWAALLDALDAAQNADTHLGYLLARPRSRLANELNVSRRQAEAGSATAASRVCELEAERDELLEASIAHDLETRRALEACTRISDAL